MPNLSSLFSHSTSFMINFSLPKFSTTIYNWIFHFRYLWKIRHHTLKNTIYGLLTENVTIIPRTINNCWKGHNCTLNNGWNGYIGLRMITDLKWTNIPRVLNRIHTHAYMITCSSQSHTITQTLAHIQTSKHHPQPALCDFNTVFRLIATTMLHYLHLANSYVHLHRDSQLPRVCSNPRVQTCLNITFAKLLPNKRRNKSW